jgi:peptidoglycan/xylan/chitin deacetylase (PgdA/CDA1 family)
MSTHRLRAFALNALYRCGVLGLWSWTNRRRVTILMMHGVTDPASSPAWRPLRPQMSPERLDECLRVLSRRYRFVSLADAVAMLQGRIPVIPFSLAVTFDDGYRNQLKYGLAILRKWDAPGTFFLSTGHVEWRRPFWFDRLDYALQQWRVHDRTVTAGSTSVRLNGRDRAALRAWYKELRDAAKDIRRPDAEMILEMESLAERFEGESGRRLADVFEDDDWTSIVDWDDVKRGMADDVTFGSHTVDHLRLAFVDAAIADDQLRRSREAIEQRTGQPCRYFCYPNGSVSPVAASRVAHAGYEAAVGTEPGLNAPGDDLMRLRRMSLPETGGPGEILAEVSGFLQAIRRLARAFGRRTR